MDAPEVPVPASPSNDDATPPPSPKLEKSNKTVVSEPKEHVTSPPSPPPPPPPEAVAPEDGRNVEPAAQGAVVSNVQDEQPVTSGMVDHGAGTSGGGGDELAGELHARSYMTSPASTSGAAPSPGVERALSDLAFSRFRNSMRAEARRSSARRSLLGRLGALPTDETSLAYNSQHPLPGGQWPMPGLMQPPIPSQHPGLPFQGQVDSYPAPSPLLSSEGSLTDQSSVTVPPPPTVHQSISAYERFARAEYSEHIYGVGRLVWKRISVDELISHSRVRLRAPLIRSLASTPLSGKATTVFAHLKAYMEDPPIPENVQPSDVKFLDTLRLMKASVSQKLAPAWEKLQPVRTKMTLALLKVDKTLRTKLFVQRTRHYHLQQILLMGIKYESLRDEIYCQICKQTTMNPMTASNARGWQAMSLCTGTFLPSQTFMPVLEEHMRQVADGVIGGAPDPEKARTMAIYSLERLRKLVRAGPRHVVPSTEEILATEHMRKTQVNVVVPGDNSQVVFLDSTTTGGEITAEIAARLGLADVGVYGIFVVVNGVEKYAGTQHFLLESHTEWNIAPQPDLEEDLEIFRKTRKLLVGQCAQCLYNMDPDSVLGKDLKHGIIVMEKLKEKEEASRTDETKPAKENEDVEAELQKLYADIHLLFKKNWFPVDERPASDSNRAFDYAQATYDVVHGQYVLEENDAVMLAALQLRAEHGSSEDLDSYLTTKTVENYGPKEYVTGYEKAWRNAILKKVATLPWEIDVNVCRNDYLAFLRSRCPLYGSSWFYVLPRACPQLPREVYFVLNFSGVYFVDVPLKEQLLHLKYIELCSWGHSDCSFSLVTGNMSYNMEFRLATRNGKEITKILQYFIKNVHI